MNVKKLFLSNYGKKKTVILQKDGAMPYFFKEVRAWLNEKCGLIELVDFLERHAPQTTPLDCFLWKYIKTNVYKTKINDIAVLKERIEQEIEAIKKETLENVFDGFSKRLNCSIDVNGHTF